MKSIIMSATLVVSGLVASGLTGAVAHEVSASYSACIAEAGGATFLMQDCITAELAVQDKRLNAAYNALMKPKVANEKRRLQLRDVQRKWIAFRDANCAYYDDGSLGQAARLAANECVLKLTADRAVELENLGQQ